jgi:hypothetical protein
MIAARQIAFGGSKRKPYDAEIEYLESTGTQYIDTGKKYDGVVRFVLEVSLGSNYTKDVKIAGYDIYGGFNGELISGLSRSIKWAAYQSKFRYDTLGGRFFLSDFALDEGFHSFEIGPNGVWADRVQISTNKPKVQDLESVYLFGYIVHNLASVVVYCGACKIRRFYDANGSFDFIPVRVGNIGYMYDRVSGQLFGNEGTGAFVIGSDI